MNPALTGDFECRCIRWADLSFRSLPIGNDLKSGPSSERGILTAAGERAGPLPLAFGETAARTDRSGVGGSLGVVNVRGKESAQTHAYNRFYLKFAMSKCQR